MRRLGIIASRRWPWTPAFARLERLVLENALSARLFFAPEIDIVSPKVKGYTANLLGRPRFNDVSLEG